MPNGRVGGGGDSTACKASNVFAVKYATQTPFSLSDRPPPPPKKKKWRERALRQQTYILLFIVLIHYNIVANTPWDAEPRFANDFESVLRMIGTLGFPKSR